MPTDAYPPPRSPPALHVVGDADAQPSLDLVYTEAKYTFDGQAKRLEDLTGRMTWMVGTAAGVVLAVAGLTNTITDLDPPGWALWSILGGVTLVILAALLCLGASLLRVVRRGVPIAELRQTYLDRDPAETKLALLAEWQAMYEANEAIVAQRVLALRSALVLLVAGIAVLVAASAALIARALA